MAKINLNMKELIQKAVELQDQTQQTDTDFEYHVAPAGLTVGRLVEYIELGKQKQKPYQGKPKADADEVRLTFELLSPTKNIREIDIDGVKTKVADKISITLKRSFHEKSNFYKLFNKLRYGRTDITHMAQCLNEGFLITVTHNESEGKDGKKRTYVNITNELGEYLISAPYQVDLETNESKPVKVPEALSPLRLFLWDNPTKETWDSLFIDGERTTKDDKGVEKTVSKNWLQNKIQEASNFEGSSLQALLEGVLDLGVQEEYEEPEQEELEFEEPEEVVVEKVAKAAPKKTVATAKAAPATKVATAEKTSAQTAAPSKKAPVVKEEDPLAALGLL